jgi:uncharacterized protein YjcR
VGPDTVPSVHLVSRNRRDEQQTIIYSNTLVTEHQKIQLLKAEEIASMLGVRSKPFTQWRAVENWRK